MKRKLTLMLAASSALLAACGGGSTGDMSAPRETAQAAKAAGAAASPLAIPSGPIVEKVNRVDPRLRGAKGKVDVWVSLNEPALAARKRELRPLGHDEAWRATDEATRAQMRAHRQQLAGGQDALAGALASLGARELGRVSRAHNAVAVRVDAARLQQIGAMSGVAAVRPVVHYRRNLPETVPYIGASLPHKFGVDGRGVTVAVFDSGIDYTHAALGGPGTTAAYQAAFGNLTSRDGLFPTSKVVEGFDFVGGVWPNCDPDVDCRSEDDDPIDAPATAPTDGGHGTHVADIIAGKKGVAPGATLLAREGLQRSLDGMQRRRAAEGDRLCARP